MIEKDKIYKLVEASKLTGFSPSTLRLRIKTGRLKKVSENNEVVRIWGSELIRFMKGN